MSCNPEFHIVYNTSLSHDSSIDLFSAAPWTHISLLRPCTDYQNPADFALNPRSRHNRTYLFLCNTTDDAYNGCASLSHLVVHLASKDHRLTGPSPTNPSLKAHGMVFHVLRPPNNTVVKNGFHHYVVRKISVPVKDIRHHSFAL